MDFIHKFIEKCFLAFQKAKLVGEDYYGNSYFLLKTKDCFDRNKRYVKYFDKKNASAIPPLWSAWLRYSLDDVDIIKNYVNPAFVKYHKPNVTGTEESYLPDNHMLNPNKKSQKKLYKSWLET